MSGYQAEGYTDYEEQVNWDAVGSPVPVGDYDLEVTKAEYKPTSAGKHMVKVQFTVENAHDPENVEKGVGRILFDNFVFTQEGGFRVKSFAENAQVELPMTISKSVCEQWAEGIIGAKVSGSIKHREFQGSLQANIGRFMPYGTSSAAPAEPQADAQPEPEPEAAPAPAPKQVAAPTQSLRNVVQRGMNGTNGAAKPAPAKNGTAAKPTAPKQQVKR